MTMERELVLTQEPIDEARWVTTRRPDPRCGAVVTFLGVVRDSESDGGILALDYTAFVAMAEHQFGLLFDGMAARWPIASVRLVHRLGEVRSGEASLWVELRAPHRAEALAACGWLIDEMKRVVPIWKRVVRGGD
jgi:molybdopterin synthase catalytic subunit